MIVREADINITNACNLNCIHCAFSSGAKSKESLSLDVFKKLVDGLIPLGLEDMHLTGGEPTIHPHLEEMITYAVGKNVNVRLISNGYVLSEEKLIRFKNAGLKSIMISLDGLEKTHNMIRGKADAFERTVNTIKVAKKLGYNVRVNAVISKNNCKELKDLILFVASLNVDVFSFFLYSPTGRNAKDQLDVVVGALEWKALIKELRTQIKQSEIGNMQIAFEKGYYFIDDDNMDFASYKGRGGGCYYLHSICDYVIILANGDVYPCALLTDKSIPYGNINEKSIKDILKNRLNIGTYKGFENKSSECNTCNYWEKCKGGCKAFVYAHNEDWNKNDPRCVLGDDKKFIPLCPLHKENFFTGKESGYSELVVE